jgi:hypothetical protein
MIIFKSYKFAKKFNYFIDFNSKLIYILYLSKKYVFKIPSYYFIKNNNKILNLLFINYFYFLTFIKFIFKFYNKYFIYYFFNLKLKGLGYRIKKLSKKLVRVYFNRSNYYYIHIPHTILFKYRTRKLFFISINNESLKLLIYNILILKDYIIYRFNGLVYSRQIFLMKPGKNKFR